MFISLKLLDNKNIRININQIGAYYESKDSSGNKINVVHVSDYVFHVKESPKEINGIVFKVFHNTRHFPSLPEKGE